MKLETLEIEILHRNKCGEIFYDENFAVTYECFKCTKTLYSAVEFDHHILLHIKSNEISNCFDEGDVKAETATVNQIEYNYSNENNCKSSPPTHEANSSPHSFEENTYFTDQMHNNEMNDHDQQFSCDSPLQEDIPISTKTKSYICKYCPVSFNNREEIDRHQNLHYQKILGVYGKPIEEPVQEIRQKSTNKPKKDEVDFSKPLICPYCNKEYNHKKKYLFKDHVKEHEGNGPTFECDICCRKLNRRANLIVHMRIHTGEKPYVCPICNKRFRQAGEHIQHVRRHKGELPYQCSECGKRFVVSYILKKHIREEHSSTFVRHKCPLCPRDFKIKDSLNKHLVMHSGEKPFECDQCKRKFATKKLMIQHTKIHSGQKPHLCKYCNIGFAQSAGRRGHEKRVHENPTH